MMSTYTRFKITSRPNGFYLLWAHSYYSVYDCSWHILIFFLFILRDCIGTPVMAHPSRHAFLLKWWMGLEEQVIPYTNVQGACQDGKDLFMIILCYFSPQNGLKIRTWTPEGTIAIHSPQHGNWSHCNWFDHRLYFVFCYVYSGKFYLAHAGYAAR